MKRKHWLRIVLLLALVLLMICTFRSCFWKNPPSVSRIEAIFQKNHDDIQYITNWLLNSEYEEVVFWGHYLPQGEAWADFSLIPLEPEVHDCVKRLMDTKGFFPIAKHSHDNAIVFCMMSDRTGAECGVAYAIDPTREPCVQYQMSLEPLSEENWFYFYTDYNEWRVLQMSESDK